MAFGPVKLHGGCVKSQIVNCGEESLKITGSPLVNILGTPTGSTGSETAFFREAPRYRGGVETPDIKNGGPGVGETTTDPGGRGGGGGGGRSASRISNTSRITDPGGHSLAAPNRASELVWALPPADSGQHWWTLDKQSYPLLGNQRADQSKFIYDILYVSYMTSYVCFYMHWSYHAFSITYSQLKTWVWFVFPMLSNVRSYKLNWKVRYDLLYVFQLLPYD